ncbi:MAG: PIG-L deacetylase family protein, partial [Planctomycetota bacterium]
MESDRLVRNRGGGVQQDLAQAFGPGPWLVLAPHDDDAPLGCGLLIAAARADGIRVHVAVVSDGRMGWNRPEERPGLVQRRRQELHAALADLGLAPDAIHELGFSDGDLLRARGCRGDDSDRGGRAGLGRALTGILRTVAPGAVFTCTPADLHPDHQAVGAETDIACCWAASPIWQELGPPISAPRCWHYAVYCAFPTPPDRQLCTSAALLEQKLRALARFDSQPFIDDMVARLRSDGPVEYFSEATWQPYRPADHGGDFSASTGTGADDASVGAAVFTADCRMVAEVLGDWTSDPGLAAVLARPLRLVGEGSSRLFPAGFARHLARRSGLPLDLDACGGRAAEACADARPVLWCSNSGATREVVEAARRLAHPGDRHLLGIGGGPLCS